MINNRKPQQQQQKNQIPELEKIRQQQQQMANQSDFLGNSKIPQKQQG